VAANLGFLKTPAGKGFAVLGTPPDDPAFFGRRGRHRGAQGRRRAAAEVQRRHPGHPRQRHLQEGRVQYFDFDIYGK
jgi:arginine/ornithine transport system substrate-binding protein